MKAQIKTGSIEDGQHLRRRLELAENGERVIFKDYQRVCREIEVLRQQSAAEIAILRIELVETHKDAARYRWLRTFDRIGRVHEMLNRPDVTTLDAAVDKLRQTEVSLLVPT